MLDGLNDRTTKNGMSLGAAFVTNPGGGVKGVPVNSEKYKGKMFCTNGEPRAGRPDYRGKFKNGGSMEGPN